MMHPFLKQYRKAAIAANRASEEALVAAKKVSLRLEQQQQQQQQQQAVSAGGPDLEDELIQCEINRLEALKSLPKGSKEKHALVSSLMATSKGNQLSAQTHAAILSQRSTGDDSSMYDWKSPSPNWKYRSKSSLNLPFTSPPD